MKPTLKQMDRMLSYRSIGLNFREIAILMKMSYKTVHYYLHKYFDDWEIYGREKARDKWNK
jgi:DNA-directed RNA polymerase specialized sigma24 family protein